MIYADVIIDISHEKLDRTFLYRVPEEMEGQIQAGMVVSVPFGNGNKLRKGYVTGLSGEADFQGGKIKEIQALLSDEETTESRLIALAAWMRHRYGSTMIQALRTVLPIQNKVKAKEKRYLVLTIEAEEGKKLLDQLSCTRYKARTRLLAAMLERKVIPASEAAKDLGASASVLKYFQENKILEIRQEEILRKPVDIRKIPLTGKAQLTDAQKQAVCKIRREWESDNSRTVLLHGITGSGKTLVYIELIQQMIKEGKQAIVLIPEIALTYQTVHRFCSIFGDKVSVLNSRLSQGERYDQFKRAKKGEIQIMVGPRSALFTPFPNLGLIIMDEEHEPTYKSENTPRYHTREAAVKRGELENAHVILGSATPSLEAYKKAQEGEYLLVTLNERYADRPLPKVSIIDMRGELKAGNRSALSRSLKQALEKCLEENKQAMLFLNRRGYAGFVSCRSCGHVMKCPHCDVSLSEHQGERLICHYCGYEIRKPQVCPVCGSPYIGGFKAGTQQIQQILQKEFPEASVLRMDYDTTRNKGSYEQILASFSAHKADILVGTQMIVKGHDFPDVTLVGVLAADMSLNGSDYRCGERTFQLLTQAVGRSGRGLQPGTAVIQTYNPDHYSIQAAAVQDYPAFYQEEMGYRMLLDYPPAAYMMAVLGACEQEELLTQAMHYTALFIRRVCTDAELHMIGPAPQSVGKVKDMYKKVIYLKHQDSRVLIALREKLEQYMEINSGFRKIYIQFDFS